MWFMLRREEREDQRFDVNWVPRSEVRVCGKTSERGIQEEQRA
jgi:hypothetical protein